MLEESRNTGIRSIIIERMNASSRGGFSLRMAPMIDMIFLLLIFFLVAAKWRPQEDFLPFKLPAAMAGTEILGKTEPLLLKIRQQPEGCSVQIDQFESILLKNETFEENLATLPVEIRRIMSLQKRVASDPVEIICDSMVKWEYVAKLYNMLYSAGLSDITFQMTE